LSVQYELLTFFAFRFVILKYRGALCTPISQGYESRTIPIDIKEEHESRMNQQVYTASPVKMSNKDTDSEMYEISPYATFSVAGGRTTSSGGHQGHAKTPTRGLNASALDYTLQFKTFGHPETENLNSTAYPLLSGSGFGHVKGKSSWHKQKYYSTDGK
jgi:Down syndrome cell adhesion molecule